MIPLSSTLDQPQQQNRVSTMRKFTHTLVAIALLSILVYPISSTLASDSKREGSTMNVSQKR